MEEDLNKLAEADQDGFEEAVDNLDLDD